MPSYCAFSMPASRASTHTPPRVDSRRRAKYWKFEKWIRGVRMFSEGGGKPHKTSSVTFMKESCPMAAAVDDRATEEATDCRGLGAGADCGLLWGFGMTAGWDGTEVPMDVSPRRLARVLHRHLAEHGLLSFLSLLGAFRVHVIKRNQAQTDLSGTGAVAARIRAASVVGWALTTLLTENPLRRRMDGDTPT